MGAVVGVNEDDGEIVGRLVVGSKVGEEVTERQDPKDKKYPEAQDTFLTRLLLISLMNKVEGSTREEIPTNPPRLLKRASIR